MAVLIGCVFGFESFLSFRIVLEESGSQWKVSTDKPESVFLAMAWMLTGYNFKKDGQKKKANSLMEFFRQPN